MSKGEDQKKKLLNDLYKHKKAENAAKKKRTDTEVEIEKLYGSFDEKSKTFLEEELGFKIKIKKNSTVKLDQAAYAQARVEIPEELRPEKIKFEVDSEGMKWLKKNNLEIYQVVSNCITEKPGKTSVTVEKI